jgi:hypothetical protein
MDATMSAPFMMPVSTMTGASALGAVADWMHRDIAASLPSHPATAKRSCALAPVKG